MTTSTLLATAPCLCFNPLFLSLVGIVIFLLIIILVLADVLKGSALVAKDEKLNKGKALGILAFMLMMGAATHVSAQAVAAAAPIAPEPNAFNEMGSTIFYMMVATIVVELLVIVLLINSIKVILGLDARKAARAAQAGAAQEEAFPVLLDKFNNSVAIEQEETILMDHDYDGIKELDNDLPPWWKYGFYVTIIFACIYVYRYHIAHSAPSQAAEYKDEMVKAEAENQEFMKKSANAIDENTVKRFTDADNLAKGKELFTANCVPCHLAQGQGLVGPNLTDEYWIHGGSIKDIFKTIKYGWPDKGMKSWKEDFSPLQIAEIASYVKSLRGTNPPNPKAPQGDLYVDKDDAGASAPAAKAATDSTNLNKK